MAATRVCSIPNCGKPVQARGWCAAHYKRWNLHGDPLGDVVLKTSKGAALRYLEETVLTYAGMDCLIWPFHRSKEGYGRLNDGRSTMTHRIVCESINGPPPSGQHEAAHSCGNGHLGCVTPRHLSWKTPKENSDDKLSHGTMVSGEQHGKAKLSENQVREIWALRGQFSQREIASRFGVTQSLISRIYLGLAWARLPISSSGR